MFNLYNIKGGYMKILIIEDEYSLADAIAETLQKEKFQVTII